MRIWDVRPFAPKERCVKIFQGNVHNFEKVIWSPCGPLHNQGHKASNLQHWHCFSLLIPPWVKDWLHFERELIVYQPSRILDYESATLAWFIWTDIMQLSPDLLLSGDKNNSYLHLDWEEIAPLHWNFNWIERSGISLIIQLNPHVVYTLILIAACKSNMLSAVVAWHHTSSPITLCRPFRWRGSSFFLLP